MELRSSGGSTTLEGSKSLRVADEEEDGAELVEVDVDDVDEDDEEEEEEEGLELSDFRCSIYTLNNCA